MPTAQLPQNSDEPDDVVGPLDDAPDTDKDKVSTTVKKGSESAKKTDAVPLTKARAKAAEKAAKKSSAPKITRASSVNPVWLVPTMLTLLIGGLIWVVLYYLTSSRVGGGFPIPALKDWNIAAGFGLILVGGVLSTRYK